MFRVSLPALLAVVGLLAACAGPTSTPTRYTPPSGSGGTYKVGSPYQIGGRWYYPREDYDYDEIGVASWYGTSFQGKRTANGERFDQNALSAAHTTLPMPSIVQVTNLSNRRSIVLRVNDRGPFVAGRLIDVSRAAARSLGFEQNGVARVRVRILADESRRVKAEALGGGGGTAVASSQASYGEGASGGETSSGGSSSSYSSPASYGSSGSSRGAVEAAPLAPPPRQSSPSSYGGSTAGSAGTNVGQVVLPPPRATGEAMPASGVVYIQVGAFANVENANALRARLSSFGPVLVTPIYFGDHELYRVRLGPFSDRASAEQRLRSVQGAGHPEARLMTD
ncbi:septal ring lytic transglycosylase RlpA family protein [Pararhodospirillum oryzae]|uniref:septal ring lytic transglycosylase RlpA family protein n=1 Tax=Pararhodospirillum oryzae TaxID=478448 RepID=UPI001FE5A049|nr:septal ring lytic transglycosylase RlpA family protein [Pararhodospirillum oryzae]